MKKILFLLALSMTLILAACGQDSADETNNANGGADEEEQNESNEAQEEEPEEVPDEGDEKERVEVGETKETEDGSVTLHKRWEEGQTFETGPIVLTIDKVATASGELEGEVAEMLETGHIEYIQVDISVENTSDEDITFYSGQGTIATNTGEQVEPDMWLSGHIDGDMMAGTKANDTFFYVLENSKAEDVESIRMVFSRPYNTDTYDDVGEELDFEIELP